MPGSWSHHISSFQTTVLPFPTFLPSFSGLPSMALRHSVSKKAQKHTHWPCPLLFMRNHFKDKTNRHTQARWPITRFLEPQRVRSCNGVFTTLGVTRTDLPRRCSAGRCSWPRSLPWRWRCPCRRPWRGSPTRSGFDLESSGHSSVRCAGRLGGGEKQRL